jgi:hypothetical protein
VKSPKQTCVATPTLACLVFWIVAGFCLKTMGHLS